MPYLYELLRFVLLIDSKFETDPYDVKLHGLMTPEQYTEAIENLNDKLRRSRAGKVDAALLAAAPLALLTPLVVWGVRHRGRMKRRKRLLKEAIDEFNMRYPAMLMRWNRRPQSTLTIELREQSNVNQNLHSSFHGAEGQEPMHMIQATMVAPSIQQSQNRQSFPTTSTNALL
jgi:hypothetical protein